MKSPVKISWVACVAEFIGMALFVTFGCGSAMGIAGSGSSGGSGANSHEKTEGQTTSLLPAWVLMVALVFGLSITTLAYTIGPYSGGQLNCAVTFGLVLAGHCDVFQGIANFVAQMMGSVTGAAILCAIFPIQNDLTSSLGANSVGPRWNWWNALIGEIMGTFLLVFVVLQTACNPKSSLTRAQACIAIGLAVFMAHAVLIPIDGCSINPSRSFGPALVLLARPQPAAGTVKTQVLSAVAVGLVAADTTMEPVAAAAITTTAAAAVAPITIHAGPWSSMWIFWAGPLIGAALAAAAYKLLIFVDQRQEEQKAGESKENVILVATDAEGNVDAADEASPRLPVLLGHLRGSSDGVTKVQEIGV